MATARQVGDSIEGLRAELTARRVSPLRPKRNEVLDTLVFGFQISDYAVATIAKELDPKRARIDGRSLLDVGDSVAGDVVSGFSLKMIPEPAIVNRTGRHKAQTLTTTKFTYARVDRKWHLIDTDRPGLPPDG